MNAMLTLTEIKRLIDVPQLLREIEAGFVLYSEGKVNVPPVGFLHFDEPRGDVHIKYGAVIGDDYYVLKMASAFYGNPALGRSVSDGLLLVFSQKTGELQTVLHDECWLTDMRTAAAGAVAAKHLAAKSVNAIGIVGTGVQARLQLELLNDVVDCKRCLLWGRDPKKAEKMQEDMQANKSIRDWGLQIQVVKDLQELVAHCKLIVTTTPATAPLIRADDVQKGTHITAMGSDDHGKQELEAGVLAKADIVVADSIAQCLDHGECFSAVKAQQLDKDSILELGSIIKNPKLARTRDDQITIADLTGVAIQDIQIAKMVVNAQRATGQRGSNA